MKIVVTQNGDYFHATLANCPEVWGTGRTANEAIGQMICYHGGMFNVSVEVRYKEVQMNNVAVRPANDEEMKALKEAIRQMKESSSIPCALPRLVWNTNEKCWKVQYESGGGRA